MPLEKVFMMKNTFKLSQNHSKQNRTKIVEDLAKSDDPNVLEVARQMKEML
jgi:predicted FMN-binding regulatory protein PaiB